MRSKVVFTSLLILFLMSILPITSKVACVDQSKDFLVGAAYMTFWGTGMDIDWDTNAVYLPTLGNYSSNNKTIADQHIKWALQYGIDFFYLDYGWATGSYRENMRNAALEGLLQADSIENFSFCICYFPYNVIYKVADPNVYGIDEKALNGDFSNISETYFTHPSYLKLENKSVMILVDLPLYFADGNESVATTFIDRMNSLFLNLTKTHELFLIFASFPHVKREYIDLVFNDSTRVYDAITLWGAETIVEYDEIISYSDYVNKTEIIFENWNSTATELNVSFVPLICPGYDNTIYYNWEPEPKREFLAIVNRDPNGFSNACRLAGDYATEPHNMVLLFTWNDFKEGTSIEPTTDYSFTYLEIVRDYVPEFPSFIILPLFMITTLLAVVVYKRKHPM